MANEPGMVTARALDYLTFEWVSLEEAIEEIGKVIPPGTAKRKYEVNRENYLQNNPVSKPKPERPDEEKIRSGRRSIVMDTLSHHSVKEEGLVQIKKLGEGRRSPRAVRKRPPVDHPLRDLEPQWDPFKGFSSTMVGFKTAMAKVTPPSPPSIPAMRAPSVDFELVAVALAEFAQQMSQAAQIMVQSAAGLLGNLQGLDSQGAPPENPAPSVEEDVKGQES